MGWSGRSRRKRWCFAARPSAGRTRAQARRGGRIGLSLRIGRHVAFALLTTFASRNVVASCYEQKPMAADFREASAVFVGKVVRLELVAMRPSNERADTEATFEV